MPTFIVMTALLTLCNSDTFQPSNSHLQAVRQINFKSKVNKKFVPDVMFSLVSTVWHYVAATWFCRIIYHTVLTKLNFISGISFCWPYYWYKYIYIYIYTECTRRNVPNFGRVFLMLKYTDITQNTYVQIWTVMEIMAREFWIFDSCYTLLDYQIRIKTGRNMWFL